MGILEVKDNILVLSGIMEISIQKHKERKSKKIK